MRNRSCAVNRLARRSGGNRLRARSCRHGEQGFTLIEIMLVMTIIAAVLGLTIGLLGVGRSGRQLRDATQTVATQLRFTRARALATGQPQRFEMDLDTRAWTAPNSHQGSLPATLKVTFNGVRQEQPASRKAAIRFFPDGSATGGRISLRTQGVGYRVDVRWLTGEVTMARLPDAPP